MFFPHGLNTVPAVRDRLIDLVVEASTARAADPGWIPACVMDFLWVKSYLCHGFSMGQVIPVSWIFYGSSYQCHGFSLGQVIPVTENLYSMDFLWVVIPVTENLYSMDFLWVKSYQ